MDIQGGEESEKKGNVIPSGQIENGAVAGEFAESSVNVNVTGPVLEKNEQGLTEDIANGQSILKVKNVFDAKDVEVVEGLPDKKVMSEMSEENNDNGEGLSAPKKMKLDVDGLENGQSFILPVKQQQQAVPDPFEAPYTQVGKCILASTYLETCRDCQNKKEGECRFAQFRKLYKAKLFKDGKPSFCVRVHGFCDPFEDPEKEDLEIWMPNAAKTSEELSLEVCKQLITQLGDQLCFLIREEKEALALEQLAITNRSSKDIKISWKRLVEGIREICDVCSTTLFNYHWICPTCGFVACLSCYKYRFHKTFKTLQDERKAAVGNSPTVSYDCYSHGSKDEYKWLLCTGKKTPLQHYKLEEMRLTQIIPGNVLDEFNKLLHQVRSDWNIQQACDCKELQQCANTDLDNGKIKLTTKSPSPVTVQQQTTVVKNEGKDNDDDDNSDDEDFLGLIEDASKSIDTVSPANSFPIDTRTDSTEHPISTKRNDPQLKHYIRSLAGSHYENVKIPILISSISITKRQYPTLPHSWLCKGTLLRLLDPDHEDNIKVFQSVWKRGQPVIVSNVSKKLSPGLWTPDSFMEDYGHEKNDLINCLTGKVLQGQSILEFWKGFDDVDKRARDSNGTPMLLKLKDWPSNVDFATFCKKRFEDLMQALPLKEYTHRTGRFNLAARLPQSFMRPDLGPKMYIAYGHGDNLEKGTTVLHLDMSDAVNCMVHVGIPINCGPNHEVAVKKAVEESECDLKMIERVTVKGEKPGALWHIYRPCDADKIRDLLNKVSIEQGQAIEPNNDPIHDQIAYLDRDLRKRLREEYDVTGFPIVQCEGDAVFIPAGAPHQVRNLHNCIKIAEDFVSPENISHCFQLTEEFRNLSDSHSNHEDKLQIKNIVFHAVKDALSVLMHAKQVSTK